MCLKRHEQQRFLVRYDDWKEEEMGGWVLGGFERLYKVLQSLQQNFLELCCKLSISALCGLHGYGGDICAVFVSTVKNRAISVIL